MPDCPDKSTQTWGDQESQARKDDLARMRAGEFTLEQVQARAKARRKAAGLSANRASSELLTAHRDNAYRTRER